MTKKRELVAAVITWVIAILIGLAPILGRHLGRHLGRKGYEVCVCAFIKVIDTGHMAYLKSFGVNVPSLIFMPVI